MSQTLHGRLDLPDFHPVYRAFPHMPLVSISNSQRAPMPPVNWIATVHHGLPSTVCPFNAGRGGYLALLGRIAPEKRPDRAIEIAKRTGIPLKIAAKVDKADQDYFEETIRPLLAHPRIEFVGEVDERSKSSFLGNALALLFPIDWPEPFGLVMIEAMSAGTPVIAWRNGSVPEVIDDGVSGAIVDTIDGAVAAVHRVRTMSRDRVRRRFEARFTAWHMAQGYLDAYERLLRPVFKARAGWKRAGRRQDSSRPACRSVSQCDGTPSAADQALHNVALAVENPVHKPGRPFRLEPRDHGADPATPEIVSGRLTGVALVA
jgi:glycosyltransferase involved in cell wall biosynthesis